MQKFIFRRLVYMIIVVVLSTMFVFTLSRLAGDPRSLFLSEYTTKADWEAWGKEFGLDKPLFAQYFIWLGKAALGDFGTSLRDQIPRL